MSSLIFKMLRRGHHSFRLTCPIIFRQGYGDYLHADSHFCCFSVSYQNPWKSQNWWYCIQIYGMKTWKWHESSEKVLKQNSFFFPKIEFVFQKLVFKSHNWANSKRSKFPGRLLLKCYRPRNLDQF